MSAVYNFTYSPLNISWPIYVRYKIECTMGMDNALTTKIEFINGYG